FFTEGVRLLTVGHQRADISAVLPPQVKHRSRMAWWIADQLARRSPNVPGAIAMLTDGPNGSITETSFANFMCVVDGFVRTPSSESVLPGISLWETIDLCLDENRTVT